MKNKFSTCAIAGAVLTAANSYAASGAENDGAGILMILFLGFGAMIIAFQALLVLMLLVSMVRALFAKPVSDNAVLVNSGEHNS